MPSENTEQRPLAAIVLKNNSPHRASHSLRLLLGVLVSVSHVCAADVYADTIDRFVRSEMDRQQIPGVALVVAKHGKIVKAKGYGVANIEHSVPVMPETVFQSGSVGKQSLRLVIVLDSAKKISELRLSTE